MASLLSGITILVAAAGAAAPSHALDPTGSLPIDREVIKGELDNGLTYIVRENGRPANRAAIRLVVKAGSVDEDDDQRGLAHFVEHMLFNGTESYAGNEIVSFLESIGARFGADLNAYTSFDETVYMLEIPTDVDGLLPEGIRILSEFAHKATMTTAEIDKERGVVMDEWRGRLGAGSRVRDQQLPVLLRGSRYAERLPIGLPEVIEGADPDALRRYYEDWYHPERMAVTCVGDFDPADVVDWIRDSFAGVPPAADLRERVDWDVPAHPETLFTLVDDPELTDTSVGWSLKRPAAEDGSTWAGYQKELVARMAIQMLNERLGELTRSASPPFLGARVSTRGIGRKTELTSFDVGVRGGKEPEGLRALAVEVERARRHGFSRSEVDRVRTNMLARIEAIHSERGKTLSSSLVAEYTRHFLTDEPIPGIEFEFEMWNEFLPLVTAEDCHRAFLELTSGDGVVVDAARPSPAEGEELVGEAELLAVLREASGLEVEPWEDGAASGSLVTTWGEPGEVVERRSIDEIGVEELLLSNGLRVFVKTTDFQDDEIRFLGTSLGGTSLASDEDFASAAFATSILGESGWGGHSITELRKLLTGKVASARPFLDDRRHGISGSSTVADLPTALELAVLVMTAPNEDPGAFERFRERIRANLVNRASDPASRFHDRLTEINTRDHPRSRPMTVERIAEIDHAEAIEFYRERFANAADFAFFFVGNVTADDLVAELERTLGSLPSRGKRTARFQDHEMKFPRRPVREDVKAGTEPKSQTAITLVSYDGDDPREWHRIRTAASILQRRLRETLREDLGATYGVGVSYRHAMIGPARGKISIGFGCDPSDAQELGEEVFRALNDLRREGPTEEELMKEREIQTRDLETAREQNGFWLGSLESLYSRERDLREILGRQERIEELNVEDLHRVVRKHFRTNRHTWVVWMPEGESPGS